MSYAHKFDLSLEGRVIQLIGKHAHDHANDWADVEWRLARDQPVKSEFIHEKWHERAFGEMGDYGDIRDFRGMSFEVQTVEVVDLACGRWTAFAVAKLADKVLLHFVSVVLAYTCLPSRYTYQ